MIRIKASRFPWQKIEHHWSHNPNDKWGWGKVSRFARFGGGWDYKLGIDIGSNTIIINLIIGNIRISKESKS